MKSVFNRMMYGFYLHITEVCIVFTEVIIHAQKGRVFARQAPRRTRKNWRPRVPGSKRCGDDFSGAQPDSFTLWMTSSN